MGKFRIPLRVQRSPTSFKLILFIFSFFYLRFYNLHSNMITWKFFRLISLTWNVSNKRYACMSYWKCCSVFHKGLLESVKCFLLTSKMYYKLGYKTYILRFASLRLMGQFLSDNLIKQFKIYIKLCHKNKSTVRKFSGSIWQAHMPIRPYINIQ